MSFRILTAYPITFFRFLQLQHAANAQFPRSITLTSDPLEAMLSCTNLPKPLSELYSQLSLLTIPKMTDLYHKWQADIPTLMEDDWEDCVLQFLKTMISSRDQFFLLKFLHRDYYTPQHLSIIYPGTSDTCFRSIGTYFHVF